MAKLLVEIGAQITQLESGLQQAGQRISAFVSSAQTRLAGLADSFQRTGQALSIGLTVPIVALGTAALVAFGKIDSLKRGLAAAAGGTAEAEEQFTRLTKIAQLPGLGLEEVAKGTINLQAIGMTAEEAEKKLQVFGNAVATVGKGRAEFERAIYGVQQLANTEFPLGEDLNIIKDAIPQVTPLLKEAFGSARSEDLQKLGIRSKEVVKVITEGLGRLPAVSGGIANAFENLSDSTSISLSKVGETLEKSLNVSGIINTLSDSLTKLADWFSNLNPIMQDFIIGIAALAASIGPFLLGLGAIIKIAPLVGSAITLIGGPFTILAAVIGIAALAIIKNWDQVRVFLIRSVSYITDALSNFMKSIAKVASFVGLDTLAKRFSITADSLAAKSKVYGNQADALAANLVKLASAQDQVNKVTKTGSATPFTLPEKVKKTPKDNSDRSIPLVGMIDGDNIKQTVGGLETLTGALGNQIPVVTAWSGEWTKAMANFGEESFAITNQGFQDMVGGLAEGIGGLATGAVSLNQVAGNILGIVGDMAIKLGKAAIAIGMAAQGIKMSFSNPFTAIAAGVALVALGAAIKGASAIVSSGGSGGASSAASPSRGVTTANWTSASSANTTNQVQTIRVVQAGRDLVGVLQLELGKNLRTG